MACILHTFTAGGIRCTASLPLSYSDGTDRRYSTVYLMGEMDTVPVMEKLQAQLAKTGGQDEVILIGTESGDWNTMFSPWQEPKLGKNLGPFSGGGVQTLDILEHQIKPYVDSVYRTAPDAKHTVLAGYSLAGLLTLYALYNSSSFSRFACMSGSLWFPGWVEYAQTHSPEAHNLRIYLSLGDREKDSRNPVMAQVADCTEKTCILLRTIAGADNVLSVSNPGGHFNDVPERIAHGIASVLCMK